MNPRHVDIAAATAALTSWFGYVPTVLSATASAMTIAWFVYQFYQAKKGK